MSVAVKQYISLVKTMLLNLFSINRQPSKVKEKGTLTKVAKVGVILLLAFSALLIIGYLVVTAYELTVAAILSGTVVELQYAFIAMSQLTVLFFGMASLMNVLFLNKDNAVLSPLPFRKGVVFFAKFTIVYLGELALAALVYVPMVATSGAVMIRYGFAVTWTFFLVEVINALLIPTLPLLIAVIVSEPLAFLVARLKRKSLGNSIVMGVCYLAFFAVYFLFVMGSSSIGETGNFDGDVIGLFAKLKEFTVFNYPLTEALIGNNVALNLLIYVVGVALVTAISVGLSFIFFQKTIMRGSEGEGASNKKKILSTNERKSFMKSFFIKDLKVVLHTPQVLISIIMTIVLPCLVVFIMSNVTMGDPELEQEMDSKLFINALTTYLVSLLCCAGNPLSYLGFSLEGKNLIILKSLPIDVKALIKEKFLFASSVTALSAVVLLIVYPIASGINNVVAIIGVPLQALASGVSFSAIGLYSDLKKPNYLWTNINEILRNNVKPIKPMLLYVVLSFIYLILGIFIAVFSSALSINVTLSLFIYHVVCLIAPTVIFALFYKKMLNSEELYNRIGG